MDNEIVRNIKSPKIDIKKNEFSKRWNIGKCDCGKRAKNISDENKDSENKD